MSVQRAHPYRARNSPLSEFKEEANFLADLVRVFLCSSSLHGTRDRAKKVVMEGWGFLSLSGEGKKIRKLLTSFSA